MHVNEGTGGKDGDGVAECAEGGMLETDELLPDQPQKEV